MEEALKRWSDPDAWAAMHEFSDAWRNVSNSPGVPPTPAVLRHREYRRRRDPLEEELLRKLRQAELVASATHERPSPTDPRFVVNPDIFQRAEPNYDLEVIAGSGMALFNVEIFAPDAIPLNVHQIPDWLADLAGGDPGGGMVGRSLKPERQEQFLHAEDYRHVWLRGREFSLTQTQAKIVKVLHEAHISFISGKSKTPWVHVDRLQETVGFESAKVSQLFKRMPDWRDLIRSDRRGSYRLNIED
jgi:hypothetical protein